jgi:leucine-rich repeat kinase 2
MTVVGAAGKGKTTLLHLLMNEKASRPENTATLGVQIRKWIYQQRPGVNYEISCWDFAGQEEFYSTHQCFLTPRSIYILVYNISKAESELDALIPWLLNIQARAPSSPVIIVGTHRDLIADELFRKVRKSMRDRINEIVTKPGFPKDISFAEISCVGQKVGLDNLRAKIKEKIDGAKLRGQKIMGEMVPASYLELKSMLEEESKRLSKAKSNLHIIRKHELEELIRRGNLSQNLDKIEIEQAVQFLHECGTLLHYDDIQSNLSDLYFVDPQWLCSLMARIITLKQLTIISKGVNICLSFLVISCSLDPSR